MEISPSAKKFILHWGEMASRWGINRTVAQIHALLFVSPQPLNAEQLTELLSVSRSNVSTSLRELQGWGVVRVVHVMGDRRDHFECLAEVWDMFQAIMDERKRRVIEPAIEVIRDSLNLPSEGTPGDGHVRGRLQEMLSFLQMVTGWYTAMRALSPEQVRELMVANLGQGAPVGAGAQAAARRR